MKKLMLGLFAVSLVACNNAEPVNYVLFNGTIKNPNSKSLTILDGSNKPVRQIKVSDTGAFADTIFNANGYYAFNDGKERSEIYLQDGYELTLDMDAKEFDETIKYSGNGSDVNNYLSQKFMTKEKAGSTFQLYSMDEDKYLSTMNTLKEDLEKSLENVDAKFAKQEKVNLNYEHLNHLTQYEPAHGYFTKNRDFKVSESFPNAIEGIDLNNEEHYKLYNSYKGIVGYGFAKVARENAKKNGTSYETEAIAHLKELKSDVIKNDILNGFVRQVSVMNPNAEALYKGIMEISTDEKLKERLTKQYNAILTLAEGKDSPVFVNYENNAGGTTSLADLKGKYVYIDVWATWCKPCKDEIPHLKKVEEKYHDKNIEFVSISIDEEKDHELWKKMIKDESLGGTQLMADAAWGSKFVQEYQINGIPRFILIDPTGKIVKSYAPRPSDKKLIELFDGLKI
ncbi:TlpA disulfide reductase family protein [Tenacibaculum sp. 190524A05c]|uniref:TlpA family protein disulfide reductase n=1 Tax=Tenacibaculum platacis TaxID=3137852 RepID=UPI0032B1EE64